MINRYAELLFLIGRCLERADNYTRIINIYYSMRHELLENEEGHTWERLAAAVSSNELNPAANEWAVLHHLTFERTNLESIFSSVQQVRTHIRTLRPMLPGELWDIINTFYLWLKDQDVSKMMLQSPYLFYKQISESLALFNGAADSNMIRGQNWNFIQTGKFVERMSGTVRIMHATYSNMKQDARQQLDDELRYNRFLVLLKACGGYEAFRKFHSHEVRLTEVTEFLLLNAKFPRSIRFGINSLSSYMETNPLLHRSIKNLSIQTSDVLSSIRASKQRFGDHITEEAVILLQQLLHTVTDLNVLFAEICFQEDHRITVEV